MQFPEYVDYPQFDAIKSSYAALRVKEPLFYVDIHSWLGSNLNHICDLVLDNHGRSIRGAGQYKSSLVTVEAKPYLKVEATWPYVTLGGAPMPLMKIKDRFPGITFDRATTRPDSKVFKATLQLDLTQWPTLAMSMMWANLTNALVEPDATMHERAYRLAQAQVLLEGLYPTVKMQDLQVAADLGMVEYWEVFFGWFKDHLVSATNIQVTLPNDMVGA